MILESIVTTWDEQGNINIAPMGPKVEGPDFQSFLLRPYEGSTTCNNLLSMRQATIHVTDDVGLFAQAAIDHVPTKGLIQSITEINHQKFWRLINCHRWFAVEIDRVSGESPRFEMPCRIVAKGTARPFFGFNRAKHAVIEAAILATRLHLIDHDEIRRQLDALRPLIDKTAGEREYEAFDLVN